MITTSICRDQTIPGEKKLWESGFLAAQGQIEMFDAPKPILQSFLKQRMPGRSFQSFGLCDDPRKAWAISAAADPQGVRKNGQQSVSIAWDKLMSSCDLLSLDFAGASEHERPINLWRCSKGSRPSCPHEIAVESLKPGYVSLQCIGAGSHQLLYLFPHRNPKDRVFKHRSLSHLINHYRRAQGYAPLAVMRDSSEFLPLIDDKSLSHNVDLLISLNRKFPKHQILGENRVIAANDIEAMIQMWRSPRHRMLLLQRQGQKLFILKKKLSNTENLYVILIGQSQVEVSRR